MLVIRLRFKKLRQIKRFIMSKFEDGTEAVLGIAFVICVIGIFVCCVIAVVNGT